MYSRGSGFFDFSYTSLTLANLLIILLFFSTPSKAAQVTCLITAVLLLIDMIMIVAVPGIQIEEGWVGIVSVVWALIISIWVILIDRVVTYGKHEEEERLTGRVEPRRTLVEWLSVLISEIVLVAISLIILLLTCTLILRARDFSLPAPGTRYLVDGDKYRIHLYCSGPIHSSTGAKYPTVLFEAGELPFEDTFQTLADNALANGTIARYCYADRPGLGWSDNAPSPFPAGMASIVLSEALARAGETGPWILASAGVGSIYSRIFSSQHGSSVRGLLLIDPLHEDLLYRLAAPHHGFVLWLRGIISPLGLQRIFGAVFRGRSREDRVYGRSAESGGKFIKAKLQESLVADSLTQNEVRSARAIQREETPLVVVSSGIQMRVDSRWGQKQADLTHLTRELVGWDVVEKAPHEVWRTVEGREVLEKRLGELVRL
jgi:pimeloyl-ACP methyl ester carboxylesterase